MQIFAKCCYHSLLDISETIKAAGIDIEAIDSITIESWHARLIVILKYGQKIEMNIVEPEDDGEELNG